jgi:hypothetical protein
MTRSLIAFFVILGIWAGTALAAPGDPRVLQGTLEWPATLSAEPFVVIRGEDGQLYYADISSAQRRTPGPLAAGTRIAVAGVEGGRPHELTALALGAGDAASLGLDPASIPPPSSSPAPAIATAPPAPGPPGEPMWRVDGTVQSVSGKTVTLRTQEGRTSTVDVSQLSESTQSALRPGDQVSLFGLPRHDRKLVANGYIQSEATQPAASPRSR